MADPVTPPPEYRLAAKINDALVAVWSHYAGKRPAAARTEIQDDVVTCVLVDAVGDYDAGLIASQAQDAVGGMAKLTSAAYERDAIAAVANLTGRRVTAFISSHDPDTDIATETFRLQRKFFS